MRIKVQCVAEPELQFGNGVTSAEPKVGLTKGGPWSLTGEKEQKVVRLGLVGLENQLPLMQAWFARMRDLIVTEETNARRFREFPGLERAFNVSLEIRDTFVRPIRRSYYIEVARLSARERFDRMLDLFAGQVEALLGDPGPDCIVVCLPEELAELRVSNPRLSFRERAVLERLQREDDEEQLSLFAPTAEELRVAAELKPQAEELLFRNFYRALKARIMSKPNAVPTQVLRRHTYIPEEATQSAATRAWNLAVSLYYKAGNIPWRPSGLAPDTCFVGVSFHHLKRRSGDLMYASLAQAFSNDVEPFALRGAVISADQVKNRYPYLTEDQAAELITQVTENYSRRTGARPSRVVVHKHRDIKKKKRQALRVP